MDALLYHWYITYCIKLCKLGLDGYVAAKGNLQQSFPHIGQWVSWPDVRGSHILAVLYDVGPVQQVPYSGTCNNTKQVKPASSEFWHLCK